MGFLLTLTLILFSILSIPVDLRKQTTELYLTQKACGPLLKKIGIERPASKPLASLKGEGTSWHATTVPGGWTF